VSARWECRCSEQSAHRDDLRELQRREAEDSQARDGFKRSEARMGEMTSKLRRGMERNGITGETQDKSCRRSLIRAVRVSRITRRQLCADRYASAYLKCHYLAGVHRRDPEQSTDGFLSAGYDHHRPTSHCLKISPIDITCRIGE